MGVITNTLFVPISDRVSKQTEIIRGASQDVQSGIDCYVRVHGPLDFEGDFEVEDDLIRAARASEVAVADESDAVRRGLTDIVSRLNTHVAVRGGAGIGNMNDYLGRSGVNVHEQYGFAHEAITGTSLDAINVYRADEIEMAIVAVSSSGVGTFTDADLLGTGTGGFVAPGGTDTPNSAAALPAVYVSSGIGGVDDLQLDISATLEDGTATSLALTVPASTPPGTLFGLSPEILDVTLVRFAGGNAGDVVTVRSTIERNIGL